jgi:hypothetical protein
MLKWSLISHADNLIIKSSLIVTLRLIVWTTIFILYSWLFNPLPPKDSLNARLIELIPLANSQNISLKLCVLILIVGLVSDYFLSHLKGEFADKE